MSSEPLPYLNRARHYSDPKSMPRTSSGNDVIHPDALHAIALLILRSHDLYAALPDIARAVRDLSGLQLISLSLGEQVWIHPADDDDGPPSTLHPITNPADDEATTKHHHDPRRIIHIAADDATVNSGNVARIPISAAGNPEAFMLVRTDDRSGLDSNAFAILDKIGDMLAAALEREQLRPDWDTDRDGVVDIRQLLDIISQLATLTTIDSTIQPLLNDIAALMNAGAVSLIAPGPGQPRLFVSNPAANPDEAGLLRLVAAPLVRHALDLGQLQVGTISQTDGCNHAVAVPLLTHGEPAGLLVVERTGGNTFSFEERETAAVVARHLAHRLDWEERIRDYSRQNLLLSLVERVTAFIARSTGADDLMGSMVREIRRTFGYDCSIAIISGNRLEFRAIELGGDGKAPDWVSEGIPLETGIMGRAARTGQPVFVRDVSADPSFLDTGRDTVTEIAVPIRIGDQVVGVLNVESDGTNPLQNLDFEILLILASHIGIALSNRKLIAAERESRVEVEAIQRVSTIVAETLDPDESLRRIAETLAGVLGYPAVTLALLDGRHLVRRASYGYDPATMPDSFEIHEGISGRVARTGKPVLLEDVRTDPDYVSGPPDLTSEVCVPIHCNGEIVGILNVEGNDERPMTSRDLHLLTTFAEHAGVLLNNAQAYAALSREATLDPMTGVPNLRYFQQGLHEQIEQARRENQQLSLAVIDLDNLKEINDTYGHLVGDHVLRELARRMLGQLRGNDLLARYAGDEFVAIFPDVDEVRALEIVSRLLNAARSRPFEVDGVVIDLSLSIGVATYPQDAAESTELLRAADMAMYVAKESGKNRASSAQQSDHIRQRPKS